MRKQNLETRYRAQRYMLKNALDLLEWLLRKETDDGIAITSQVRMELSRFISRSRREGKFRP